MRVLFRKEAGFARSREDTGVPVASLHEAVCETSACCRCRSAVTRLEFAG